MQMTHGSLFSGIGGFDLAAEWMGWENKFHCEWNPFGQRVLKHYWPNSESFTDITKTDFTKYANKIDILSGGFPCQPYSSAGKRKGKEDERHLWPEMLRAIREISPRFVVGENVRGLTNWNGGMVFEEVCAELESYGYQVAPVIIPACAVGAPHRRERIWFVAYAKDSGHRGWLCEECSDRKWPLFQNKQGRSAMGCETPGCSREWITTNSERGGRLQSSKNIQPEQPNGVQSIGDGREWDAANASSRRISRYGGESKNGKFQTNESNQNNSEQFRRMDWEKFPTQPPICGGNDGFSLELDGITFPKWRNESIKAYGNAIVPQVAYQIFKALEICK
jgi:DNA (cytosine-5)-methyltransferase 1